MSKSSVYLLKENLVVDDFAGLASVRQKRLVKRTHSVYLSCGYGLATASGPEVCFFKELDLSKTCILLN